nr:HAMP domain-containing sensor histidine kinase [uncultured Pedobacter sp.]
MSLYENKRRWKYFLLIGAVFIAATSLWYTDLLVRGISKSERTRAEVWSQSFKKMFETDNEEMMNYLFTVNDSLKVPAIVTDEQDSITTYTALDTTKTYYKIDTARKYDPRYFLRQLKIMKAQHAPIKIETNGQVKYVYYRDSFLLTQLRVFPYIQLTIIALFLMTAYLIFSSSRRSEQNQVWVGLAKETAHQLGTPISSLMAWIELLKSKFDAEEDPLILQMENDVKRLEIVADRFSKIGSRPILTSHRVYETIKDYVDYFSVRVSDKISFEVNGDEHQEALLNIPLFDWVIENILKNAVNAIGGQGKISINIIENIAKEQIFVDITDTGKGIPRSKFDAIFQPGFTTRKRGWGLGLSLTKRIIENYHKGHVFVKESEIGKGTTFRIIIKSSLNYVPTTS